MFKLQFPIVLIALTLFHGAFSAPQGLSSSSIQSLCPGSTDLNSAYAKQAQNLANYVGSVAAGTTAGVLNGNAANAAAAIQGIAQAFGHALSHREVDEISDEDLAIRVYARVAQNLEKYNAGVGKIATGITSGVLNGNPTNTAATIQALAQAFGQGLSHREVDEISDEDLLADVNELLARQDSSCQRG